ncbi:MAG: proline dehydrogenase family protein [Deltaproteobacteria bacterium]|nr:proline dehydrogenase family protein [Deltaproteobacteria bacterium]
MAKDSLNLENEIRILGNEIFKEVRSSSVSIFTPEFHANNLINWAMADEGFRVNLFRFVDVLPSLNNSSEVIEHVQEYFAPIADKIPRALKWGLDIDPHGVAATLIAKVIQRNVRQIAKRFIVGDALDAAVKRLKNIRRHGLAFTVDLLGEATVSEDEALHYQRRYLELVTALGNNFSKEDDESIIPHHFGESTPINISVKLSALYSQAKAINFNRSVEVLSNRLSEIARKAKEIGAFLYVDMEDSSMVDIALEVFRNVMSTSEFASYERCGIVLQTYLKRTSKDFAELLKWAKSRKAPIGIRLVKGAYWDAEVILAKQHGWLCPVWQEKASTDLAYEEMSFELLQNHKWIYTGFASHNIRSLCHAIIAAKHLGVPHTSFELQTLYGMADQIKKAFANRGFLVREYAPIGDLIPGMGYLVRRLLENTSNQGFLRSSFSQNESAETLLARPRIRNDGAIATSHGAVTTAKGFGNNALKDFSLSREREILSATLSRLMNGFREHAASVAPIINGLRCETPDILHSRSPEEPALVLAITKLADKTLAQKALVELSEYFPVWRDTPVSTRADILFKAAELIERDRAELTALIILEAGKQWIEADADVAEAIDFLNYYGYQALEMFNMRNIRSMPGEINEYFYEPRGVSLVISPWNFPLAIPCGMFSAALVTGNCAILKPAEQTPLVASRLFEIFLEAGLPKGAASFIPGLGEDVGWYMANSELVSTICFTGSKEVGLKLITAAERAGQGHEHIKQVIAEMGGKNAIIVDSDADLDEAIKGVVSSAFGYQGQKCSACSRVIVLEGIYSKFAARLALATQSLIVGPASDPSTFVGPVIDETASKSITAAINKTSLACRLLTPSMDALVANSSVYILPTIFAEVPREHEISRKEIFGPVLAMIKAASFEEALEIALDSEYGLTGAVFSRSPKHIELAKKDFRVGNLYINRGCTGAIVGRQPFGGAKMSGVGSKAGGPDYLRQFVIPRSISENSLRRGFAPEN